MYRPAFTWQGPEPSEELDELNALIGPSIARSTRSTKPRRDKERKITGKLFGRVKRYTIATGYGFISHGDTDYFFHRSGLAPSCNGYVMSKERVSFEIATDRRGRLIAVKVAPV